MCGRKLQACSLNGKVRRYFRHNIDERGNVGINHIKCNPNTANETALHKMAKQIIAEERKLLIPHKNISLSEAGITDLPQSISRGIKPYRFQEAKVIYAEHLEVEKHLPDFTPDVFIKTKNGELLVEIFVSHSVNEDKKNKAEKYGAAMLEIDLSNVESPITSDKLRKLFVKIKKNKEWIYYPISDTVKENARKYYEGLEVVQEYRKELFRIEQEERKSKEKRKRANEKLKKIFIPQNYTAVLNKLRSDEQFLIFWQKNKKSHWFDFGAYYHQHNKVPFFIDIPITGEMIFRCDRRIWQSAIFNRYVYGRKEKGSRFNVENIFDVLKDDFNIKIDWDLSYRLTNPLCEEITIFLRERVVEKYVSYLEVIGFIRTDDGEEEYWKTTLANKTIIPPIRRATEEMEKILRNVDVSLPNIDFLISEALVEYYEELDKEEMEKERQRREERLKLEEERRLAEAEVRRLQILEAERKREERRLAEVEAQKLKEVEEKKRREEQRKEEQKAKEAFEQFVCEKNLKYFGFCNFSAHKQTTDMHGSRETRCVTCNRIKPVSEMQYNQFEQLECDECISKKRKQLNFFDL